MKKNETRSTVSFNDMFIKDHMNLQFDVRLLFIWLFFFFYSCGGIVFLPHFPIAHTDYLLH